MQKQSQWGIKNLLMLLLLELRNSYFALSLSPIIKVTIWLFGIVYEASRCTGESCGLACAPMKSRGPTLEVLELSNSCKFSLLLLIPQPFILHDAARSPSYTHSCCVSSCSVEQDFAYFFSSRPLIFNKTNTFPPPPPIGLNKATDKN